MDVYTLKIVYLEWEGPLESCVRFIRIKRL